MQFDLSQLQSLLTTLNQTDISELTLRVEDFELVVRRQHLIPSEPSGVTAPPIILAPAEVQSPVVVSDPTPPPAKTGAAMPPGKKENTTEIVSPMVGTFYAAPAPGEPPFVSIGDTVKPGQTVCIIEAMKLMNELEAEVGGQVLEILVENGQPVEFNQPLMRIAKS
jgi:acetyl-CoA carboxylase biotin carboxyl carrier protein